MKRCNIPNGACEAVIIGASAFGAGVLLTVFMPPCALCGICGLVFLGVGITCALLK